ncbi:MAG TPA: radical SAM protein, partial [Candidatus Omnitrophota bacterium]|nr:radical SAM protein [Candidatus Omnitrophota bacterium]
FRKDKEALLKELSSIEGVYVPAVGYTGKITKRFVKDMDKVLDFSHWVLPYIEIVHDRLTLEIMRGCPNKCKFCQARCAFYPLRIASTNQILETAKRLYKMTGYDEISLLSLSSSDHPQLKDIVLALSEEFKEKGVSISLPSLRAKTYVGELSRIFASTRKTSLTFAPEAGTERLRSVIGKNIDINELFSVAKDAYAAGYRLLKLYFMVGLPTETDQDLCGIVDMAQELSRMKKEISGHPAQLNLSISNFIPKPHTHFQRVAMSSIDELINKQESLKSLFKKAKGPIKPSYHDARASFLEGIFSRGDRALGKVILKAFEKGARFDSWTNMFNFGIWQEAFLECGIDPDSYLRERKEDEVLPWDFIDLGFKSS